MPPFFRCLSIGLMLNHSILVWKGVFECSSNVWNLAGNLRGRVVRVWLLMQHPLRTKQPLIHNPNLLSQDLFRNTLRIPAKFPRHLTHLPPGKLTRHDLKQRLGSALGVAIIEKWAITSPAITL